MFYIFYWYHFFPFNFSELSVTLVEDHLNEKVAKNVTKCIKMYAAKTEQQLASGQDAAQVIGSNKKFAT